MPKINVYLPDDLAEAVKEAGLPVSAICQRVLEQSVKRVSAVRAAVVGELAGADPTAGLNHFTKRAKEVITLAITNAGERGAAEVGTRDVLHGMIIEGANVAMHVLRSFDVDPATVRREIGRFEAAADAGGPANRIGRTAANALELTVTEAISLGHNYIGCEHLLLGLLAEPDGAGGTVLRGLGVELRAARHAVSAFLSGYVHLRDNQGSAMEQLVADAVGKAMRPVLRRLDEVEAKVG
jgi:ATP-dependent Clp protease ATP-binding subunit ClpA/post-segregation antitoxin (ccd killing protein)